MQLTSGQNGGTVGINLESGAVISRINPLNKPCAGVDACDKSRNERQKAVLLYEAARLQCERTAQEKAVLTDTCERTQTLINNASDLIAAAKELLKHGRLHSAATASRVTYVS